MLRILQSTTGLRVIWVNAICINQSNLREREDQVAKMSTIYDNSVQFFIFLGSDVVNPIERGKSYLTRQDLHILPLFSKKDGSSTDAGTVTDQTEANHSIISLDRMFQRGYFTRTWTVQELWLSPQAVIRIGSTEYRVTNRTCRQIGNNPSRDWNTSSAPWFADAYRDYLPTDSSESLLSALASTWSCQASDPRDRVFGLLGLNTSTPIIRPDYRISAKHIFIGLFARCLINLQDIRVLIHASGQRAHAGNPSWMPSWESSASQLLPIFSNDVLNQWEEQWQDSYSQLPGTRSRSELEHTGKFISGTRRDVLFLPLTLSTRIFDRMNPTYESGPHSWRDFASVSATSGVLNLPLAHLFQMQEMPIPVHRMEGLACFLVKGQRQDLVFTTRNASQPDSGVLPGDRMFALDRDPRFTPVFLILRELPSSEIFSLVLTCDQVMVRDQKRREFSRHHRRGLSLRKLFRPSSAIPMNLSLRSRKALIKQLWCLFLGKPDLDKIAAILKGCANERKNTHPNVVESYVLCMESHGDRQPYSLCLSAEGGVRLTLSPESWTRHENECNGMHQVRLPLGWFCRWLEWRDHGPGDGHGVVFSLNAGQIRDLIIQVFGTVFPASALSVIGSTGFSKLRNDLSHPAYDMKKFPRGMREQPWVVCPPTMASGYSFSFKFDFDFDFKLNRGLSLKGALGLYENQYDVKIR